MLLSSDCCGQAQRKSTVLSVIDISLMQQTDAALPAPLARIYKCIHDEQICSGISTSTYVHEYS